MHPFVSAVKAHDHDAIKAMLAPDVVFSSPVAFAPYEGRELVAAILRAVVRVFGEMEYVREIIDAGGRDAALVFETTVGERSLQGCDFLRFDDDGLIAEFTVMVRPLSAAQALAEAMAVEFEQIKKELTA